MTTLSLLHLKRLGACEDQVKLFETTFGRKAEVTPANLQKALAAGLDFNWLARKTLQPASIKAYHEATAPAQKAYDEARATAQKAYDEARATAWKAYDEATAPARKAYDEARATAWKAYDEARAPAQKAYDEARATAWMNLYLQQEKK